MPAQPAPRPEPPAGPTVIRGAITVGSGVCTRRAAHAPASHEQHRPEPSLADLDERDVWRTLARMLRARDDARRLHPSARI